MSNVQYASLSSTLMFVVCVLAPASHLPSATGLACLEILWRQGERVSPSHFHSGQDHLQLDHIAWLYFWEGGAERRVGIALKLIEIIEYKPVWLNKMLQQPEFWTDIRRLKAISLCHSTSTHNLTAAHCAADIWWACFYDSGVHQIKLCSMMTPLVWRPALLCMLAEAIRSFTLVIFDFWFVVLFLWQRNANVQHLIRCSGGTTSRLSGHYKERLMHLKAEVKFSSVLFCSKHETDVGRKSISLSCLHHT